MGVMYRCLWRILIVCAAAGVCAMTAGCGDAGSSRTTKPPKVSPPVSTSPTTHAPAPADPHEHRIPNVVIGDPIIRARDAAASSSSSPPASSAQFDLQTLWPRPSDAFPLRLRLPLLDADRDLVLGPAQVQALHALP